jgi:hypothetical protein
MTKKLFRWWIGSITLSVLGVFAGRQTASAAAHHYGLELARGLVEGVLHQKSQEAHFERHELVFNGAPMIVESVGFAIHGVPLAKQLFAEVRRVCRTPVSASNLSGERAPVEALTFEGEEIQERFIYCFRPRVALTAKGISQLLAGFERNGDLQQLGKWHGAYLKTSDRGASLVAMESAGSMKLEEMFPRDGDCPGSDHAELPRPSGRRITSILHNRQSSIVSYEFQRPAAAVLSDYLAQVGERDDLVLRHPQRSAGEVAHAAMVQSRDASFVVTITPEGSDRSSLVLARLP